MAQQNGPRAVDELLEEVRALRELVARIEKRTIYLRPDGVLKSAGKQLAAGALRGVGVLLGGIVFLILFGFILQRTIASDAFKNYIGEQIQGAVTGAIEREMNLLPFQKTNQ